MLCFLSGCSGGDKTGRMAISGKVLLKGEPVPTGSIEFVPHPGVNTTSGAVITNGRFSIPADKGLEPGNYTVKISWIETPPPSDEPGGLPGKDPVEKIPAKYNTKSTLTTEIKTGQPELEFKLD
jgi:hypothetical protein